MLRHWGPYCTFVWSWEFLTNAFYWQRVWITTPVFTGTIEYVTSCVFAYSAANLPAFIRAKPVWITTWKQTRIKHQQQKQQQNNTNKNSSNTTIIATVVYNPFESFYLVFGNIYLMCCSYQLDFILPLSEKIIIFWCFFM